MAINIDQTKSPLRLNDQVKIFDEVLVGSGTLEKYIRVESASIYSGLYVSSISGTLDIKIEALGNENQFTEPLINYENITAVTSTVVERQAARTFELVRITVTYTDDCEFNLHLRGIDAGEGSVRITGANVFNVEQMTIPTVSTVLIGATLSSRQGILISNENSSGNLLVAETSAKVTTGTEVMVIRPNGGTLSIDLGPGQTLYARSVSGTVDVRIAQVGG